MKAITPIKVLFILSGILIILINILYIKGMKNNDMLNAVLISIVVAFFGCFYMIWGLKE